MRIIKLNKQIKKRFIFLLIIFICFSSSLFLITYSLKDQIAYFVEPTDLKDMNELLRLKKYIARDIARDMMLIHSDIVYFLCLLFAQVIRLGLTPHVLPFIGWTNTMCRSDVLNGCLLF